MTEAAMMLVIRKYGAWFVGWNMFWPVYRDFVQGFMRGLLG